MPFIPSGTVVYFDENVISVTAFGNTITTSGDFINTGTGNSEYTVVLKDGYVIDTVTADNSIISNITDTTFYAVTNAVYTEITITSKQSTPTYPKINSFIYHGKQINHINGKPIRYVHYMGNTYEMVYAVQLAAPQNVTADGTTVSWDEVENATSYAVLADGTSIGTTDR